MGDAKLLPLLYLSDDPTEENQARRVVLERKLFSVLDGALHFENQGQSGRLRLLVPESLHAELLKEAHGGQFAGHFSERMIYDGL